MGLFRSLFGKKNKGANASVNASTTHHDTSLAESQTKAEKKSDNKLVKQNESAAQEDNVRISYLFKEAKHNNSHGCTSRFFNI